MRLAALRFDLFARHLAASKRPILVGPWRAEVGFECLYWLPFLTWFRDRYRIPPERLIAWSRGGASAWYGMGQSLELYGQMSPDEIRVLTLQAAARTGSTKQMAVEPWERALVALTGAQSGTKPLWLHPAWMYRLLAPFWQDKASPQLMDRYTKVQVMKPPPVPANLQLPPSYVAVRFYARPTWAPNEEQMGWMRGLVERLAKKQPVILLNSGHRLDDHADLMVEDKAKNIHSLDAILTPQNNLAVISAVLGRAQGFVGTYGGLAQLGLRMGVPSVSCYTHWGGTAAAHLTLSQRLSLAMGVPFHVCRPQEAQHWEGLLG